MSSDAVVRAELEQYKGDMTALMQHYGEQVAKIITLYGGNVSDVPMDPKHEYHQIQEKIRILGALSHQTVTKLGPEELETKRAELKKKGKMA